jgi:hypothetical protein
MRNEAIIKGAGASLKTVSFLSRERRKVQLASSRPDLNWIEGRADTSERPSLCVPSMLLVQEVKVLYAS